MSYRVVGVTNEACGDFLKVCSCVCCYVLFYLHHLTHPRQSSSMLRSECAVCGKSFTRLASHLVRSFECESYYNSRTAHNNDGPVNATNEQREGSDDRIRRKNRKSSSVREADDEEAVANVNAGAVEDDDL